MLKLISVAVGCAVIAFAGLVSAQTANNWRDSTDYLGPATPATGAVGVNPEPQARELSAPRVKPHRHWYGGQVLLSDAVTVSVLTAGIALAYSDGSNAFERSAPGLIWTGALGYALTPAVIHAFHRRPAMALLSTTMRVGIPGLGLVMGALSQCPIGPADGSASSSKCDSDTGGLIGLFAGIGLATFFDVAGLAYDAPKAEPARSAAQFGLAPFLSPDGKRAEVRAFGTF